MGYKSNRDVLRFASCKYHVVVCPKFRRKVLVDTIESNHRSGRKKLGCKILELEVTPALACGASVPDHVHILCEVDPQFGEHKLMKRVKGLSSCLLRQELPHVKSRLPALWTHSYFVSMVSGAPIAILKQYIKNQKNV